MNSGRGRIEFLRGRDGFEQTRAWMLRTLDIYRRALRDPSGYAGLPEYRRVFEASIREFERQLGCPVADGEGIGDSSLGAHGERRREANGSGAN